MKLPKAETKTEQAYQLLRQEILENRLEPGMQLRLGEMREKYGLGWTPLREALTRLEGDHLVVLQTNRGFAVAPVSMERYIDLSKARLVLEAALLRESIEIGGPAWEERVLTAHSHLVESRLLSSKSLPMIHPSVENFREWDQNHRDFHFALLEAASSEWLKYYYQRTILHLSRHFRFLLGSRRYQMAASQNSDPEMVQTVRRKMIDSHTDIMDAALSRDQDRAIKLITEHVQYSEAASSVYEQDDPARSL